MTGAKKVINKKKYTQGKLLKLETQDREPKPNTKHKRQRQNETGADTKLRDSNRTEPDTD